MKVEAGAAHANSSAAPSSPAAAAAATSTPTSTKKGWGALKSKLLDSSKSVLFYIYLSFLVLCILWILTFVDT